MILNLRTYLKLLPQTRQQRIPSEEIPDEDKLIRTLGHERSHRERGLAAESARRAHRVLSVVPGAGDHAICAGYTEGSGTWRGDLK